MTTVWEMNLTFAAKTGIRAAGMAQTAVLEYKRHSFGAKNHGAFCNQCADGMVQYDAAEAAACLTAIRNC